MKLTTEHKHEQEPFINADGAAQFLSMNRLRVVREARAGRLPGYPYRRGRGNDWFFLKSELAAHMRGEVKSLPRPFVVETERHV
jgi:hypothetical protein